MKILLKNNIKVVVAFLVGAIVFGGVSYAVATGISSGDVTYTANNQTTVQGALNDLYTKAATYINPNNIQGQTLAYKCWNDNFGNNGYYILEAPATVYTTRAGLETACGSSNFANSPVYIRSTYAGSYPIYHESCLRYNNKEFCLAPNYWVGDAQDQSDGSTTKAKLKTDMEATLGITINASDCRFILNSAGCDGGDFECNAHSSGYVYCIPYTTMVRCHAYADGYAICES